MTQLQKNIIDTVSDRPRSRLEIAFRLQQPVSQINKEVKALRMKGKLSEATNKGTFKKAHRK